MGDGLAAATAAAVSSGGRTRAEEGIADFETRTRQEGAE